MGLFEVMTISLLIPISVSAPESISYILPEEAIVEIVEETANIVESEEASKEESDMRFSREDIELIALVTMAEAEGESEEGKRLVIDTILNRVDSKEFPNTVNGVIYQRHAFSSMHDGRVDECFVDDKIVKLVLEEYENRKNREVLYFTAGRYSKYGTPLFQLGHHYFSK